MYGNFVIIDYVFTIECSFLTYFYPMNNFSPNPNKQFPGPQVLVDHHCPATLASEVRYCHNMPCVVVDLGEATAIMLSDFHFLGISCLQ